MEADLVNSDLDNRLHFMINDRKMIFGVVIDAQQQMRYTYSHLMHSFS